MKLEIVKFAKSVFKQQWVLPLILVIIVVTLAVFHAKKEMFGPYDTDPQYTGYGIFPKAIADLFIGKEMISANPSSDDTSKFYMESKFDAAGEVKEIENQMGHFQQS